jgi:hypothetical protein
VSALLAPPPSAAPRTAALSRVEAQPAGGDGRWTLLLEFAGVAPDGVPPLRPADVRILALGDLPMRVVGVSPVPGAALRVDAERAPDPPDPETVPRSRAYLLSLAGAPGVDPAADRAPFSLGSADAADPVPPPAAPAPVLPDGVHVDYLAKDYDSFRTLLLDYMAAAVPRWTERSPADLGVVLVELLAYAGDALSYFQDAAATEAYLYTARRRTSVRRHARLMDYHPSDGCSAVAWVQVAVSDDGLTLPAGTELMTRIAGAGPCLGAGSPVHQRALALSRVFETLEPVRPRVAHNRISLYTWGMPDYVLPRGSTHATLVDGTGPDGGGTLRLAPGDVLVLEEARAADTGAAGGDPTHRCAVRLVRVDAKSDPAAPGGPQPLLEVEWWGDDALPFDLRVAGYAAGQPFTDGAYALGNLVLAGHGRSAGAAVPLGTPRSDGTVPLPPPSAPLTRAVPYDPRAARGAPAAAVLRPDPRRALPAVRVMDGDGHAWTPVHDLLGSGPFSRDVVVEIDEDESAALRFGDGRLGMRPDPGVRLRARWRTGYGPAGNVGPDALAHLVASGGAELALWAPLIAAVRNPLPAAGGAPREPLERVRMAAPEAYRALARAVTADDWANAALAVPGVLHATAELRWAGSWPTAFVTVQRAGGAEADDAYLDGVHAVLEPLRPAGHALALRGPAWAALDVELRVRVHAHRFQRTVQGALAAALGDGVRADGTPAFFHPGCWTFGQQVHLAPLLAAAMEVDGVQDVAATRFRRMDAAQGAPLVSDPIPVGPREVARATSAAGAGRAYGRVAFLLEGGE